MKNDSMLIEQVKRMEAAIRDFRMNPYDPETAHTVRVSSRTFRSLLWLEKEQTSMKEAAKQIAKQFEELRESDVTFTTLWKDVKGKEVDDLVPTFQKIFKELEKARREAARKVLQKTATTTIDDAMATIWDELGAMPQKPLSIKTVQKRLSKEWEKLEKRYLEKESLDQEALHNLRKKLKRFRYNVETREASVTKELRKMAKKAKVWQEELGDDRDREMVKERLTALSNELNSDEGKNVLHQWIQTH